MDMNTTGKKTPRTKAIMREAHSSDPIYSSGYKVGQKRLKDFSENTQETASPSGDRGMESMPIEEALKLVRQQMKASATPEEKAEQELSSEDGE
jgi:hypothetical protein